MANNRCNPCSTPFLIPQHVSIFRIYWASSSIISIGSFHSDTKKKCMVKLVASITNCWNYMLVGDSCTYTIKHGIRGSCFDKNNTQRNT